MENWSPFPQLGKENKENHTSVTTSFPFSLVTEVSQKKKRERKEGVLSEVTRWSLNDVRDPFQRFLVLSLLLMTPWTVSPSENDVSLCY